MNDAHKDATEGGGSRQLSREEVLATIAAMPRASALITPAELEMLRAVGPKEIPILVVSKNKVLEGMAMLSTIRRQGTPAAQRAAHNFMCALEVTIREIFMRHGIIEDDEGEAPSDDSMASQPINPPPGELN